MLQHIVLFGFKEGTSAEAKQAVADGFLALKSECKKDGQPYIVSIAGGNNNSPEGFSNGLEHGYIVTFRNAQDRDYYVKEDPSHRAFTQTLQDIAKATVVDFEDGKF